MRQWKIIGLLIMSMLLLSAALPVYAAPDTTALPPLPEWPIIGPILKWLGVVEKEPAEIVEMPEEPDLPEYQIETRDDIFALQDLAVDERVHLIATDTALTAIAQEALDENVEGVQNLTFTFTPGKASVSAEVDPAVLEKVNLDLPGNLKDPIQLEGTVNLTASECRVIVTVEKVSLNRWSLGLRRLVQRWIDDQLPGAWPNEVCVEHITLKSGEIAVIGHRR
ncbi:MAG TPA: hypothetical protein PLH19_10105 [Anaerolineae bacterium]|nr:hypothetical protein [Anaerolineae bacterium]HQH38870.1 hypothetical protein [Anaerolineae bacterium]